MSTFIKDAHMPFAFRHEGRDWLLFCRGRMSSNVYGRVEYPYKAWSLHYCAVDEPDAVYPLTTGFPENAIECNPCAYLAGNTLNVTFAATRMDPEEPARYGLWRRTGARLPEMAATREIDMKQNYVFNGFSHATLAAWCNKTEIHIVDLPTKHACVIEAPVPEVVRVVYLAEDPQKLLITCHDEERDFTLLYSVPERAVLGEVMAVSEDGSAPHPVYKCTILENALYWARRGKDHEERDICRTGFVIMESDIVLTSKRCAWTCPETDNLPLMRAEIGRDWWEISNKDPAGPVSYTPRKTKKSELLTHQETVRGKYEQVIALMGNASEAESHTDEFHWLRSMVHQCQMSMRRFKKGSCADRRAFLSRQQQKVIYFAQEYARLTTGGNSEDNELAQHILGLSESSDRKEPDGRTPGESDRLRHKPVSGVSGADKPRN